MSNNIFKLFKACKTADCGYISVLAHRAHDLPELEKQGWVRSESELKTKKAREIKGDNSKDTRQQQFKAL